jgi:hypothetical protein
MYKYYGRWISFKELQMQQEKKRFMSTLLIKIWLLLKDTSIISLWMKNII